MKILIIQIKEKTNPTHQLNEEHLKKIKQIIPKAEITITEDREDKILPHLKEAEIVIPSTLKNIDFSKAPKLRWLHLISAGADTLPKSIINSDVLVTNSSGVHPIPITEQIFAYMLLFSRQINKTMKSQLVDKKWSRELQFEKISELHGKIIAIIGLGRIGKKVAELAKAFNMKVIAVDKNTEKPDIVDELYPVEKADSAIENSDFNVICLPLTKETTHLFNYEKFKKMKPSSYIINIGRGPIINEQDLVKALKENLIAGAGLDVFEEEPLPESSELWQLDNVILTPHHAGYTPYYMDRVIEIFCNNLRAFLKNEKMPNLINKKLGY